MSAPIAQDQLPEPGAPGAILATVPAFRAIRDIVEATQSDVATIQIGKFDKPLTWAQREAANRFVLTARAQGFRAEVTDNEYVFIARVVIKNRRRQES